MKKLATLLVFIMVVGMVGVTVVIGESSAIFRKADTLVKQKKYSEAVEILRNLIKQESSSVLSARAQYKICEIIYNKLHDIDKAMIENKRLIRNYPEQKMYVAMGKINIACFYAIKGDYLKAIELLESFIKNPDDKGFVSLAKTELLRVKKEYKQSISKSRKKQKIRTEDEKEFYAIDKLYSQESGSIRIIRKYQEFIKNFRKSKLASLAQNEIADCYATLGMRKNPTSSEYRQLLEKAIKEYKKVINNFSKSKNNDNSRSSAYSRIAHIYEFHLGSPDKELDILQQWAKDYYGTEYGCDAQSRIVNFYSRYPYNNIDKAIEIGESLIRTYPDNNRYVKMTIMDLGFLYGQKKNYHKAVEYLEKYLQDPEEEHISSVKKQLLIYKKRLKEQRNKSKK